VGEKTTTIVRTVLTVFVKAEMIFPTRISKFYYDICFTETDESVIEYYSYTIPTDKSVGF
jgi:hypothetical protein